MKKQKDKHRIIKEKIVEALEGRKEKEEDILSLFYGKGKMRRKAEKRHKVMYKIMVKNLVNMDIKILNDIHKGVINTGNHLL